jgi:ubiquinone/menaquinone biosynthesis C-methylase UbiE
MKSGFFEYAIENNRLRSRVRENMEVKPLRAATEVGTLDDALHVACGNGRATELILKYFPAKRMSAIDREADLISVARQTHSGEGLDFSVQDVRSLGFADGRFDAVFDLADLHNHADWEKGLAEMWRVLRPGGLLILEELSRESFERAAGRLFKALTEHPYDRMLTAEAFKDRVLGSGFEILRFEERNPFGLLKYFLMIARKNIGHYD